MVYCLFLSTIGIINCIPIYLYCVAVFILIILFYKFVFMSICTVNQCLFFTSGILRKVTIGVYSETVNRTMTDSTMYKRNRENRSTNNDQQSIAQKTKDWVTTRTSIQTLGKLRWSESMRTAIWLKSDPSIVPINDICGVGDLRKHHYESHVSDHCICGTIWFQVICIQIYLYSSIVYLDNRYTNLYSCLSELRLRLFLTIGTFKTSFSSVITSTAIMI